MKITTFYSREDRGFTGSLHFIHMDMTDLEMVRSAAREFQSKELRLDVLFNNTGTSSVKGKTTRQGNESHIRADTLGLYVVMRLLHLLLSATSKYLPLNSVWAVFSASCLVELLLPKGGIPQSFLDNPGTLPEQHVPYTMSKTGNWFLASELTRQTGRIQGCLRCSKSQKLPNEYMAEYSQAALLAPVAFLRDYTHGASTHLWMGLSDTVILDGGIVGKYATPDGKWHPGQRGDLLLALRGVQEGGLGLSTAFYKWCDSKVREFCDR